jgi:hypothetical protein
MIRILAAALVLASVASPASAFFLFQGPWNVAAQHAPRKKAVGGEASLSPTLRGVVATIRAKYGAGSIRNIGGARNTLVAGTRMPSCHNGGHAFDAHLSPAALAYVRSRKDLGVITYSGRMHHVHVSDCARERGGRWHKRS